MSDFTIGLDLDGIVYEWDKTARYMLRTHIEAAGGRAPTELFFPAPSWNAIERIVSPSDWHWLWSDAIEQGLYRYGHVVRGAVEGVQRLTGIGDVTIITSRPKLAVNDTIAWVSMMFNHAPLAGIVIQSNGQCKSEVHPVPNVYIDDTPHVADDILDNTMSLVVMLNQPWNASYLSDVRPDDAQFARALRLFRARNWPDIVNHVAAIKREAVRV